MKVVQIIFVFFAFVFLVEAMESSDLEAPKNLDGTLIVNNQNYNFDHAVIVLRNMLRQDSEQQKKALRVITKVGKGFVAFDDLITAVEELTDSPDEEISSAAVNALNHVGSTHSRDTFKKIILSNKSLLRSFGAVGLQRLGDLNEEELNLIIDTYFSLLQEPIVDMEKPEEIQWAVIPQLEKLAKDASFSMPDLQKYMTEHEVNNMEDRKKRFQEYVVLLVDWWQQHRDEVVKKLIDSSNPK